MALFNMAPHFSHAFVAHLVERGELPAEVHAELSGGSKVKKQATLTALLVGASRGPPTLAASSDRAC